MNVILIVLKIKGGIFILQKEHFLKHENMKLAKITFYFKKQFLIIRFF